MSAKRIQLIEQRLNNAFQPSKLIVIDEGEHHIGHAGAATGLGHFAVDIEASAFRGKSTLEAHRLIYEALGELMQTDIHALRIKARHTE